MMQLFIGIFIVMQSLSLVATSEELFLRGNALYKERQFEQAFSSYEKISNKGPAVWYALGSCSYHLGNYKQALSFLTVAERGASWKLLKAIDYTKQDVAENLSEQEKKEASYGSLTFIQKLVAPISLLAFQILFLIFLVFGVLFIIFFKKKWRLLMVLYGSALLIIGLCMAIKYSTMIHQMGIIQETVVALYAGPDENYHTVGQLNQATTVIIYEIKNSWCKVQCEQLVGWVQCAALMII